jgi:fatty-acyl-CoA synthase
VKVGQAVTSARALTARVVDEMWAARELTRSGLLGLDLVPHLVPIARAVRGYGAIGAAVRLAALRYPDRVAVIDDHGCLTFGELDARSNAVANHWRGGGLQSGDGVAILARNHRGFLDAVFGSAKCGARIILLNTDFGAAQLREVVDREGVDLLVFDEEFGEAVTDLDIRLGKQRAWTHAAHPQSLDAVIDAGDPWTPPPTGTDPKIVILTSGTTGTPKGASRSEPRSLVPVGGLLDKAPFRAGEVTECAVPMFHALGFAHVVLAVTLGSTLVIRRRFDPQATLSSLSRNHVTAAIVVPVMLARILDLGPDALAGVDLSALRLVFVAGSQLGASLCTRATGVFGPVLYNLYGSTEVAYATIATPADLGAEPGCVGRVVHGAIVKILDDRGDEVPADVTGRIFVANSIQFDGYTGGGGKTSIRGLMASGDVGHFDSAARLFIDGRDDDMIVSGGENVFPAEVEETLARHPDITEAAAVGVPDDEYGERLRCYVVLRKDAKLTAQDIKDYVRHELARFKVPRDVRFIDQLPRNPAGKVLKRQLDTAGG